MSTANCRRFKIEQKGDDWHVWTWRFGGWVWVVYTSLDAALAAIKHNVERAS